MWRRIDTLPDALRPDRSGVMLSFASRSPTADAPEAARIVGRAGHDVRDFDRPETLEGFTMFVREGSFPVWKVSERGTLLAIWARRSCHLDGSQPVRVSRDPRRQGTWH